MCSECALKILRCTDISCELPSEGTGHRHGLAQVDLVILSILHCHLTKPHLNIWIFLKISTLKLTLTQIYYTVSVTIRSPPPLDCSEVCSDWRGDWRWRRRSSSPWPGCSADSGDNDQVALGHYNASYPLRYVKAMFDETSRLSLYYRHLLHLNKASR